MESVSLLEKINSKYIINDILNYVKDSNQLLKLAKYCKRLQNSFKFKIEDYKKKVLKLSIIQNLKTSYMFKEVLNSKKII
jgi:hypothetical protein